jgi:hypothetical protein
MSLLIFYLTDDRRHFTFPHFAKMLNESHKKEQWKLLILTHSNDSSFYQEELKKYNIHYQIDNVNPHNNYLTKANSACNHAEMNNFPYVMKCDNDIFIKSETLDFLIDNLYLLENKDNLTLGPVLTTGIPGIEYFKEEFLDEDAQKTLENIFLTTQFDNRFGFGAIYDVLNEHTIHSSKWDKDVYFDSVRKMNHHYKGIHPIRVNDESICFLNDYIIRNKNRFLQKQTLSVIDNDKSPYLCNSIFCIKTNIYKSILQDTSLFVDAFDEVPLNKFAWNHNMKHLFTKNGYAIHMYYNWKDKHISFEHDFCNRFFDM